MPHNPDIASVFFRAGLIEAWGRGTIKIIDVCIKEGVKPPKFSFDANGVLVEFETETSQKTTQKTEERILEIIAKDQLVSRSEIAKLLGDITEDGVK